MKPTSFTTSVAERWVPQALQPRYAWSSCSGAGTLLAVRALRTNISTGSGALDGVTFSVAAGETLGILGESGSGVNLIAGSILHLLQPPARIVSGAIILRGRDVRAMPPAALRAMRGRDAALIGPTPSLNPALRISIQVAEALRVHGVRAAEAARLSSALLARVRIAAAHAYPHQMTQAARQLVMLAMAISNNPPLLLADEPTGALDVTDQADFLRLMQELRAERGTAILLVSRDPGVIAGVCTRAIVIYAGEVVEEGPTDAVLTDPRHPYTRALLDAAPYLQTGRSKLNVIPGMAPDPRQLPPGCRFAARCPARQVICDGHPDLIEVGARRWTRCFIAAEGRAFPPRAAETIAPRHAPRGARPLVELRGLTKQFPLSHRLLAPKRNAPALQSIDLVIQRGETLGVVGESAAGKSTLCRLVMRLSRPTSGQILFDGTDITRLRDRKLRRVHTRMQMLFQNLDASFDPRMTIADILAAPLRAHRIATTEADLAAQMLEMLNLVGLPRSARNRYGHQCSAGEKQRLAIGRALMLRPELIVADEPLSPLDVIERAQIINLMIDLQPHFGLTYLFVARDLAPLRIIADRILVLQSGQVAEIAPTEQLFRAPQHPTTRALIAATTFVGATAGSATLPTRSPRR